jgi:dolichol-phosphate mannosyltransferase
MKSAAMLRAEAEWTPDRAPMRGAELTVVVPTYRESENVPVLIERVGAALAGIDYEIVFVDDNSPDGTASVVKEHARIDARVRCLHRIGRRGLSSAVVEGFLSSSAPFVAVIDGDLQHDETLLVPMLQRLRAGDVDLVVGSRYVEGGSLGDWTSSRAWMSAFAGKLSRLVLKGQSLKDPMSGFFMTRREQFDRAVPRLSIEGFKILLDFVASSEEKLRIAELPYEFRNRLFGESKLDSLVLWEYGMLLTDKLVGHLIPARFVLFGLVGATGVIVHFSALTILLKAFGLSFVVAQAEATLVAMTTNFELNNLLTYRDQRLRGTRWIRGLVTFYGVCGIGALANVGIANALFERNHAWWSSALAGIVVGTVFNYVLTSMFTWKRK